MIITRTPFRISFFGGGTDYPEWFETNGGAVLATTINRYCYLTLRRLPPFFTERHRVVYNRIELTQELDEIQHPAVRACLKAHGINDGVELVHNADLPARTGLGSSSSFTVGLLNALNGLDGRLRDQRWLATEAIRLEREVMGENVGWQDQILAAFGGFNRIDFSSDAFHVRPLPLTQTCRQNLLDHLLLFYTGVSRYSSDIARDQIRNIPRRETQLREMAALVPLATEALMAEDYPTFGAMLHESWIRKRSLSDRVSTEQIDDLYARALAAGAWGGKVLGAGGGGFILIMAEPGRHQAILSTLGDLLHVPFRFETEGSRIIFLSDE
ncbi:MAG: kinase [Rhodospirillum sp.]|nr:kinase [Rhodospirillum sp.]MCF8487628.1 kinase [Rhodospirillum sp.]MCF8499232.1 kinase [Rhodospirillum sp.]